mmetsp:Transcript_33201/g.75843  ORF Transcript_33201/g.75843 Transcript_33201/m.75843 type:complete len:427 (+) Transcript_33201:287-1567(+)
MRALLVACAALLCSDGGGASGAAGAESPREVDEVHPPRRRRDRRRTRYDPHLHDGPESSAAGGAKSSKAKGGKSKQGKGHPPHGGTYDTDTSLYHGDAAMPDDDGGGGPVLADEGSAVEIPPPPIQASFGGLGGTERPRPPAAPSADAVCGTTAEDRSASLLEVLGEDPSVRAGLLAPDGPDRRAWTWLAYRDGAALCPGDEAGWRVRQRHALASLYYSTGGDGWANCPSGESGPGGGRAAGPCHPASRSGLVLDPDLAGAASPVRFLGGSDECDWFGVACDGGGRVVGVVLPSNGLRGPIPGGLYGAVPGLRVLDLSMNGIAGGLSTEVGGLAALEVLKLNNNNMSGTIPFESISRLDKLENLSLGGNDFTGDATAFCEGIESTGVRHFTADCAYSFLKSSPGGPADEEPAAVAVVCPCCTLCMR